MWSGHWRHKPPVSKCADTGADQGAAGGNGWRINTPGEACDALIQVMYCEVRVLDLYYY